MVELGLAALGAGDRLDGPAWRQPRCRVHGTRVCWFIFLVVAGCRRRCSFMSGLPRTFVLAAFRVLTGWLCSVCRYLWRETYRDLGLDDDSIQTAFNGPAFMSWSRSYESGWQNGAIFNDEAGSPGAGLFNVSLQEEFLVNQWELQVRVARPHHANRRLFGALPVARSRVFPSFVPRYTRRSCLRP